MEPMPVAPSTEPRVARLIDANLDRAREGLRVVEDWCRFGLDREDLVVPLKDWRQQLGLLHEVRNLLLLRALGVVLAQLAQLTVQLGQLPANPALLRVALLDAALQEL